MVDERPPYPTRLESPYDRAVEIVNRILELMGYLLFLALLFLVTWKLFWGFVSFVYWPWVVSPFFDRMMEWPTLWRFLVGLPVTLILFSPAIILLYLLYEKGGWLKIADLREKKWLKGTFDTIRKGFYCFATFASLKFVYLANKPEDFDWWEALWKLLSGF